MSTDYKFEGWLARKPEDAEGKMEWGSFEPKKWTEDDVDIQVTHCGICGTDFHVMSSSWNKTLYPCCAGHEIVGKAVHVGSRVKHIKVGDRVGVGAQGRSCLRPDCEECSTGQESYCPRSVATYAGVYPDGEGISYGGYSNYNRNHGNFVFKIPDGVASEDAAPMLCAGATVYASLKRFQCGPGKKVGIIGIGGLGHFGILFAKALEADKVVAISRKASKRDDALALGADEYIATDDDENWAVKNTRSLDLILCLASSVKMPFNQYLGLLKVGGTIVQLGAPDGGDMPTINALTLLFNGVNIAGAITGSPAEIREMLDLAAEKQIKPWVELRPMEDANQAIVDFEKGKPRYRYVLVNEKHL